MTTPQWTVDDEGDLVYENYVVTLCDTDGEYDSEEAAEAHSALVADVAAARRLEQPIDDEALARVAAFTAAYNNVSTHLDVVNNLHSVSAPGGLSHTLTILDLRAVVAAARLVDEQKQNMTKFEEAGLLDKGTEAPRTSPRAPDAEASTEAPLPGPIPEPPSSWPDPFDFIVELREAVGLFAGAMPITPKQAWDEAIARVRALVASTGTETDDAQ